jgi:hypothetical protein
MYSPSLSSFAALGSNTIRHLATGICQILKDRINQAQPRSDAIKYKAGVVFGVVFLIFKVFSEGNAVLPLNYTRLAAGLPVDGSAQSGR